MKWNALKKICKKFLCLVLTMGMMLPLVVSDFPVFADDSVVYETNPVVEAKVAKMPGNKSNVLTITITDTLGVYAQNFEMSDSEEGEYGVEDYIVYVATSGNSKITECRIVDYNPTFIGAFDYETNSVVEAKVARWTPRRTAPRPARAFTTTTAGLTGVTTCSRAR